MNPGSGPFDVNNGNSERAQSKQQRRMNPAALRDAEQLSRAGVRSLPVDPRVIWLLVALGVLIGILVVAAN